jgi:hypothetical protein
MFVCAITALWRKTILTPEQNHERWTIAERTRRIRAGKPCPDDRRIAPAEPVAAR